MRRLITSDIHLSEVRPALAARFVRLLERDWRDYDEILILGDLFDAWIGDDDDSPWLGQVLDAMRRCSDSGVGIGVQFGNHDFLYGEAFCQRSGARLLDEHLVLSLGGEPALLMHGDQLCTRDTDYQAFRRQVRAAAWRAEFLARSLEERRAFVQALRSDNRAQTALKPEDIMDVTREEVLRVMREHGVLLLIHGHTHRPHIHQFDLDGSPARRLVLGSWERRGWRVEANDEWVDLVPFDLSLN